jgi:hypothetical protein
MPNLESKSGNFPALTGFFTELDVRASGKKNLIPQIEKNHRTLMYLFDGFIKYIDENPNNGTISPVAKCILVPTSEITKNNHFMEFNGIELDFNPTNVFIGYHKSKHYAKTQSIIVTASQKIGENIEASQNYLFKPFNQLTKLRFALFYWDENMNLQTLDLSHSETLKHMDILSELYHIVSSSIFSRKLSKNDIGIGVDL